MPNRLDTISFGKIVQIREKLLKAQAAGRKVYRFESGDPSFSVAPGVIKAIETAASTGKTHYVPNDGIPELKKALKAKLAEHNGIELPDADCVFVTNGAMHGLYVTWQCLLGEGDEVIVPDPMWTEAVENIRLAGAKPVPVVLRHERGYVYDADDIAAKLTARTRAIFVNSPHNPTGAVLPKEALERILALAHERGLYIVTDEAYEDVTYDAEHHSLAALARGRYDEAFQKRIVSIFSFSKSYAMSGLRVGCIVTQDARLQERISKLLRCTINGVNSVAQWAAVAAVQGDRSHLENMRREYRVRRDLMLQALSGVPGLSPFKPEGAFYVWCKIDPTLYPRMGVKNADELSAMLAEKHGLGSAPGDSFGLHCDDAIRFAYSCSTEMVKEGAAVLAQFFHPAAAEAALRS